MIVSDMEKISSFQEIDRDSEKNPDTESENIQGDVIFVFIYDMREIDSSESEDDGENHRYEFSFSRKEY